MTAPQQTANLSWEHSGAEELFGASSNMADIERIRTEDLEQNLPGAFPDNNSVAASQTEYSTQQSLAQAVHARRSEFTRPKEIKIKVGSWNVAGFKGTEKDIGPWLVGGKGVSEKLSGLELSDDDGDGNIKLEDRESVEDQERRRSKRHSTVPKNDPGSLPGDEDIGIYVVGLQEVVDITSASEALRPYTDPAVAKRYRKALEDALPKGYVLVAEQQLIGLLLLIYAAPDVAPEIKHVSTTSVGTGLMGYMGNKGATTARIVLGETTRLVFVNCHLAAGADAAALDRRNWDAAQIISRTRFEPIVDPMGIQQQKGEVIGEEDFAFWFGDLNYRLQGMPGDDVRRLLMLHARNEYDLSRPHKNKVEDALSDYSTETASMRSNESSIEYSKGQADSNEEHGGDDDAAQDSLDPASLQATLDGLLPHDELYEQIKKRKAFQDGWREGPIKFMPTYKYDMGTVGVFDSSEKRRCPSWCDRILYRTRRDKLAYDNRVQDEENVKRRDEELHNSGVDQEAEDEEVMFEYNPDNDGDDYDEYADTGEPQTVLTRDGYEDIIRLDTYTSHQRVLSSDHKPLVALFSLKYDAVVPELKTKVHSEVAKDLDRAENESRPTITLIIDRSVSAAEGERSAGQGEEKWEGVDFGNAHYAQTKRRSVTIANTGQVTATVGFVNRPVGVGQVEGAMPVWLSAKFDRAADNEGSKNQQSPAETKYTLEPGDATTVTFLLKIQIMDLVRSLNEGTTDLDDILVLHVDGGRDHFLPIRARWLQNTLGRSIDKLIRIPEGGIRRLQGQKPNSGSDHKTGLCPPSTNSRPESPEVNSKKSELAPSTSKSGRKQENETAGTEEAEPVKWSAPRELFRLTEAVENLAQRCIADWDMRYTTPLEMLPQASTAPSELTPSTPEDQVAPPLPPRPDTSIPTPTRQRGLSVNDQPTRPKAPWEQHSGWPFWEDSWSNIDQDMRVTATEAIYEALDTDRAFDDLIDASTPNLPRLEAAAGVLVTFLSSLTDGIITAEMWTILETDLVARAKDKGGKTPGADNIEDEKSHILEILSESSAHNVSFVLITSMLHRLVTEIAQSDLHHSTAAADPAHISASAAASTPTKGISLPFGRRRGLSRASEDEGEKLRKAVLQRRKLRERAYSVTFAEAMVRFPDVEGMKDKEKKARSERSFGVIETFVRED